MGTNGIIQFMCQNKIRKYTFERNKTFYKSNFTDLEITVYSFFSPDNTDCVPLYSKASSWWRVSLSLICRFIRRANVSCSRTKTRERLVRRKIERIVLEAKSKRQQLDGIKEVPGWTVSVKQEDEQVWKIIEQKMREEQE